MNPAAIIFTIVNAIALLVLPRRWAPIPLLIGTCYMTLGQGIQLGPFSFTVIRILILAGITRILLRGELRNITLNKLDFIMIAWAFWALIAGLFHESTETTNPIVYRLGLAYNTFGIYILFRALCRDPEDAVRIIILAIYTLIPVACEMVTEHITSQNLFAVFGGVPESVTIRGTKLRAQGPFAHGILAGTVGAVTLPLAICIWPENKRASILGILTCLTMVATSNSSGPIMSTIFSLSALSLWKLRHHTKQMRWLAVLTYLLLEIVMKAPAYYLIARIDLTGSSTGWHRAELIKSTIAHFDEWWLFGTEYTRHWMPTGVSWSPNHTDITNHYIGNAVNGGLLQMLLFILCIWQGFKILGKQLPDNKDNISNRRTEFRAWTLGSSLFSHSASCISIYYFDQSFVFLYLLLAIIGSANPDAGQSANRPSTR